VVHFGFRLQRPEDIQHAEDVVRKAGGTIKERGEFVPGEPYVFFNDPDGYEVEIWYEIPTKVDPKPVTGNGDYGDNGSTRSNGVTETS
jgi:hypothetical protein